MSFHEFVGNLHVHTPYSDGEAFHAEIAEAALAVGLDFVIFTDHNVHLDQIEGYYGHEDQGYVLLLSGEEVHDRTRLPQCNHLLVYGAEKEVTEHAHDLSTLINAVKDSGGLTFIAHPDDQSVDWLHEPEIPWVDRYVDNYTGLEIWNYMSRFKDFLPTFRQGLRSVFRPEDVMIGPSPLTLNLWDQLLEMGRQVVGIGSADAHGTTVKRGPITHTVFPYDFLFNCVNTHILTRSPLSGHAENDKTLLFQALKEGRAFIGYDLPGNTRGFRFSAQGQNTSAMMGQSIRLGHGVTLQAMAPARAHFKIICHGEVVAEDTATENLTYVARTSGAYRVEVWRRFRGSERAWILSNPIYVGANPSRALS